MGRIWIPLLVGAAIALGTFALAQAQVFEPSGSGAATTGGDFYRGEVIFEGTCATCHGAGGEGGSAPALRETGLDAAFVTERVRAGTGAMPRGLVTGQDEADVVAYVVSISAP